MPELASARSRVPFPQTPTSPEPPNTVVEQDLEEAENVRKTLQKGEHSPYCSASLLISFVLNLTGYQSLALIATFLSDVEAQFVSYSLADGDKSSHAYQTYNTLFLVAIVLSMFGAVTGGPTLTCAESP